MRSFLLDLRVFTSVVPELGNKNVARRGNAVTKFLARLAFKLSGWQVTGEIPDCPKFVAIGAPHTSNWDWVIGMMLMYAVGIKFSFLIKKSVFVPVFGPILKFLGGIPVDRSAANGIVGDAVRAFKSADRLILAITPEGTRKSDGVLKTGFYRIAVKAKVPILVVGIDYPNKRFDTGLFLEASLSEEEVFSKIHEYLETMEGRNAGFLGSKKKGAQ